MAAQYYVIPCTNPDCQTATWIPQQTMRAMAQERKQPATGGRFVNFVCPHCGFGAKNPMQYLQVRESPPGMRLGREPLLCITVRCSDKDCQAAVSVYTKCASESGAEPTIAPQYWRSATLECPAGHRARQPIEVMGSRPVADEEMPAASPSAMRTVESGATKKAAPAKSSQKKTKKKRN